MIKSFVSMLKNDDGASLVEYALIIALIAGVASAALANLGKGINTTNSELVGQLNSAAGQVGT